MDVHEIPTTYLTSHRRSTSHVVGQAFARGCDGSMTTDLSELRDGPFAAFCTPELHPLWRRAQELNRTWYYGDHAYFGRRIFYRFTKNSVQHDCSGEATPHRFEKTNFKIKPWTNKGNKILICAQSEIFFALMNVNKDLWLKQTVETLRQHTDKQIIVRNKSCGDNTEQEFEHSLKGVWAVVVFTSVAGVQAALHGVPCFATHESAAQKFGSGDLSLIETPRKPDNREQMAWALADNQWTLGELERGLAWEKLQ